MVLYRLEKSDALLLIAGETFLRPSPHSLPQLDLESECWASASAQSVSHCPV